MVAARGSNDDGSRPTRVEIKRQRRDGDCFTTVGSIKIVFNHWIKCKGFRRGEGGISIISITC